MIEHGVLAGQKGLTVLTTLRSMRRLSGRTNSPSSHSTIRKSYKSPVNGDGTLDLGRRSETTPKIGRPPRRRHQCAVPTAIRPPCPATALDAFLTAA